MNVLAPYGEQNTFWGFLTTVESVFAKRVFCVIQRSEGQDDEGWCVYLLQFWFLWSFPCLSHYIA